MDILHAAVVVEVNASDFYDGQLGLSVGYPASSWIQRSELLEAPLLGPIVCVTMLHTCFFSIGRRYG